MELFNMDEINNIDLVIWAFEKGYSLGSSDEKDGIYVEFSETRNYFLDELAKIYTKEKITINSTN